MATVQQFMDIGKSAKTSLFINMQKQKKDRESTSDDSFDELLTRRREPPDKSHTKPSSVDISGRTGSYTRSRVSTGSLQECITIEDSSDESSGDDTSNRSKYSSDDSFDEQIKPHYRKAPNKIQVHVPQRTLKKPMDDKPSTSRKPVDERPGSLKKPVGGKPSTSKKPVYRKPSTSRKPVDSKPSTSRKPVDDRPRSMKKLTNDRRRRSKKPFVERPRTSKKTVDTPQTFKKPPGDNFSTPSVVPRTFSMCPEVEEIKISAPSSSSIQSFLTSLSGPSNNADVRDHLEAIMYFQNYKTKKEELATRLYDIFNREVFSSQLPEYMLLEWSERMTSSAGFCKSKIISTPEGPLRTSRIVLSSKVLDSAEKLRNTLIHEMCHSAVYILNKSGKEGHGPLWKAWVRKANKCFPELPKITRGHRYEVREKYTYRCTKCGYSFARNKRSINIKTKGCGRCRGTFEVIRNN